MKRLLTLVTLLGLLARAERDFRNGAVDRHRKRHCKDVGRQTDHRRTWGMDNIDTGRKIDMKTNKNGEYFSVGLTRWNLRRYR